MDKFIMMIWIKVILITKNDSFLNVDNGDVGFVAFSTEEDLKRWDSTNIDTFSEIL